MRYFILIVVFTLNTYNGITQNKLNYEWAMNVLYSGITSYQNSVFKFNRYIDTATGNTKYYFGQGSNICDSSGRLYLASNGYNVLDSNGNYVDGLDSIGGRSYIINCDGFAPGCQNSIFLPFGNSLYYFVNNSVSDDYWNYYNNNPGASAIYDELLYSKIDMKGNGGAGKVLKREVKIIEKDSLSKTEMMACRHANGKDWWLLKRAYVENKIHIFLFTQDSVHKKGIQTFAEPVFSIFDHGGQSMFSEDGKKYATTNRGTGKIFVADFDRCTGVLSNPMVYDVDTLSAHNPNDPSMKDYYTEGLAFSPNGRFIYVYMYFNIQQLDLWDNDPNTRWSVVAELDTTWAAFQSYSNMQIGPDNKLYVGNWGGLSKQMSYFNNPNEKGLASDFCPRCLRFPKAGVTRPPTMPNYDLGEEQPCWPLSNGELEMEKGELVVYPNPASDEIKIRHNYENISTLIVELYDYTGRKVKQIQCKDCNQETSMQVSEFVTGLYTYKVIIDYNLVNTGKINIIK